MKKSKSKSKRRIRSRSRSNDSRSKRQKPRSKSPSQREKVKTKEGPRKTRWHPDDEKVIPKKDQPLEISSKKEKPSPPLRIKDFLHNKEKIVDILFETVTGAALQELIPDYLKKRSNEELKKLCLEQIKNMSDELILRIIAGELESSNKYEEKKTEKEQNLKLEQPNPVRESVKVKESPKAEKYVESVKVKEIPKAEKYVEIAKVKESSKAEKYVESVKIKENPKAEKYVESVKVKESLKAEKYVESVKAKESPKAEKKSEEVLDRKTHNAPSKPQIVDTKEKEVPHDEKNQIPLTIKDEVAKDLILPERDAELLELEMRARAIRSLLKAKTQAANEDETASKNN